MQRESSAISGVCVCVCLLNLNLLYIRLTEIVVNLSSVACFAVLFVDAYVFLALKSFYELVQL